MRFIKLFNEANLKDIGFISSLDKYFTVSFEFELETNDLEDFMIDFHFFCILIGNVKSYLSDNDIYILRDYGVNNTEDAQFLIKLTEPIFKKTGNKIISFLKFNQHSDLPPSREQQNLIETAADEFNRILLTTRVSNSEQEKIISAIRRNFFVNTAEPEEEVQTMKLKVKKHLPSFFQKWQNRIDFVFERSLLRGIEIKPKTYLQGLNDGIEMLNDFYADFDKQKYFVFSEKTGLHINIGTKEGLNDFNFIKGLLLLNDFTETGKTPYVFKDITWRMNNKFCKPLLTTTHT
jgi:hypothetical protein